MDLLEWITELRKALYLLLAVCYKGYHSGTAKWKRCTGKGEGEERGVAMLSPGYHLPSTLHDPEAQQLLKPSHSSVVNKFR